MLSNCEIHTFGSELLVPVLDDFLEQLLARLLLQAPLGKASLPRLLYLLVTQAVNFLLADGLFLLQLLQVLAVATVFFTQFALQLQAVEHISMSLHRTEFQQARQ